MTSKQARASRPAIDADTLSATIVDAIETADARGLDRAFDDLTRLESAVAVRTFERTIEIKRAFGRVLSAIVTRARQGKGADLGKLGKIGDAVTFANVGHALGKSGTDWEHKGRKRATLSDDLNAWKSATPDRVKRYRGLDADARTLGKRALSRDNAQHAIQWCHADANPDRATPRADGTSSPLHKRVEVTGDARVEIASALSDAATLGGDAVSTPVAVTIDKRAVSAPATVTPAWLSSLSDAELDATILACEGERKRRANARDGRKQGKGATAPATPAPDVLTVTAVADVATTPATPAPASILSMLTPAQVAALTPAQVAALA